MDAQPTRGEAQRQTLSFLRGKFEEAGLRPVTKLGQNFLIDLNLHRVIIDTADVRPNDVVLEVGTGTGSITAELAQRAGAVVTVEVDRHLFELAAAELSQFPNVNMLRRDALKNKNCIDSAVTNAVREAMSAIPQARFKLVANLPYNIATPLISNLLAGEPVPHSMTVTIQKELADRIVARPRTKDYGALSVWVQSQCDARIVRIMPPEVFWPRPKVDSAIVHITLNPGKRSRIADLAFFHEFARVMFFHRRKFLRSVLISGYKNRLDKPAVDRVMAEMGFGPTTRAEELDVETMLRLYDVIREAVTV